MPVKLFARLEQAESAQAVSILRDAGVDFDLIDPSDSVPGFDVMFSVTGTRKTPVLCVDGVAYRGLEGVRRHLAR